MQFFPSPGERQFFRSPDDIVGQWEVLANSKRAEMMLAT